MNIASKMAESGSRRRRLCISPAPSTTIDWGVSLTHFYLAEDIVRRPLGMERRFGGAAARPRARVEVDEAAVTRLRTD